MVVVKSWLVLILILCFGLSCQKGKPDGHSPELKLSKTPIILSTNGDAGDSSLQTEKRPKTKEKSPSPLAKELSKKFPNNQELIDAIESGDIPKVQSFLSNGVSPNTVHNGKTLLQIAFIKGNEALVNLLLKEGALIKHAKYSPKGVYDFIIAANYKKDKKGEKILKRFIAEELENAGQKPSDYCESISALSDARYNPGLLQYLLEQLAKIHGAKWNQDASFKPFALMLAILKEDPITLPGLSKELVNEPLCCSILHPPLIFAARAGKNRSIFILLAHGADINKGVGLDDSYTPLTAACYQGNLATVQLLIDRGAKYAVARGHAANALQAAVNSGNRQLVLYLLGKKINPNFGLLEAAKKGNLELVKLLIQHGAKVNQAGFANPYELTPLQLAAWKGQTSVVRYLISKGANIHAKTDSLNRTPLQLAQENNHQEVIAILKKAGTKAE